jgi:hypothetical protein
MWDAGQSGRYEGHCGQLRGNFEWLSSVITAGILTDQDKTEVREHCHTLYDTLEKLGAHPCTEIPGGLCTARELAHATCSLLEQLDRCQRAANEVAAGERQRAANETAASERARALRTRLPPAAVGDIEKQAGSHNMGNAGPATDRYEEYRAECRVAYESLFLDLDAESGMTGRDGTELRKHCRFLHGTLEKLGAHPCTEIPSDRCTARELVRAVCRLREQLGRHRRAANKAAGTAAEEPPRECQMAEAKAPAPPPQKHQMVLAKAQAPKTSCDNCGALLRAEGPQSCATCDMPYCHSCCTQCAWCPGRREGAPDPCPECDPQAWLFGRAVCASCAQSWRSEGKGACDFCENVRALRLCPDCEALYCEGCRVPCDWCAGNGSAPNPCPGCGGTTELGERRACATCFWWALEDGEIEFCYTHGRFVARVGHRAHDRCSREAGLPSLREKTRAVLGGPDPNKTRAKSVLELDRAPFEVVLQVWSRCDAETAKCLVVAIPRLARALWTDAKRQGFDRIGAMLHPLLNERTRFFVGFRCGSSTVTLELGACSAALGGEDGSEETYELEYQAEKGSRPRLLAKATVRLEGLVKIYKNLLRRTPGSTDESDNDRSSGSDSDSDE